MLVYHLRYLDPCSQAQLVFILFYTSGKDGSPMLKVLNTGYDQISSLISGS